MFLQLVENIRPIAQTFLDNAHAFRYHRFPNYSKEGLTLSILPCLLAILESAPLSGEQVLVRKYVAHFRNILCKPCTTKLLYIRIDVHYGLS